MDKSDFVFDMKEYAWIKSLRLVMFGKNWDTNVCIAGEEGIEIKSYQIKSACDFLDNQETYVKQLESVVFKFYNDNLPDIRVRDTDNVDEYAPILTESNDLVRVLALQSVCIPNCFD